MTKDLYSKIVLAEDILEALQEFEQTLINLPSGDWDTLTKQYLKARFKTWLFLECLDSELDEDSYTFFYADGRREEIGLD